MNRRRQTKRWIFSLLAGFLAIGLWAYGAQISRPHVVRAVSVWRDDQSVVEVHLYNPLDETVQVDIDVMFMGSPKTSPRPYAVQSTVLLQPREKRMETLPFKMDGSRLLNIILPQPHARLQRQQVVDHDVPDLP